MDRILTKPAEAQQLAEARDLLAALRDALVQFGASAEDQATLVASIQQLDDFFLLVIVGEFNAGKSAFINALLGSPVLPEGVTPTTAHIHLLTYGDEARREVDSRGLHILSAPVPLLRDVHIVDTPGTNAIAREHERLTADFVPRSDLVLFITSADRPFTETERVFLTAIRDWGKKIVIIVNKIDIFERESQLDEVLGFVRDAAVRLLAVQPEVLPVSARLAQRAKAGDPSLWAASRFEALEQYLRETLQDENRFRLKLANPIGVGRALAGRYAAIARERLEVLEGDLSLLGDVERQLEVYRRDLAQGFELRMRAVDQVLLEMQNRGHHYFEDTLRIGRVVDLMNRSRIQKEFEDKVIADAPAQVERRVDDLIDWLIDQDLRQWQAITRALTSRMQQPQVHDRGGPEVGSFHYDRARLIDGVGRGAQRVVETYDREREAATIADQARTAVATAAAAGGAALGLGTLVTMAASTAAADITGILLASVLLGVGFLIIPARRRRAKAALDGKLEALRTRLTTALTTEFTRAREQSVQRMTDAIAPYSRFVRAEEGRWREAELALSTLEARTATFLH